MALQRVFNSLLSTNTTNITDTFFNPSGILLVFPNQNDDFELDFYLQLETDFAIGKNRLIKIEETYRQDSISVWSVPSEYLDTSLGFHGTILSNLNIFCEIWIIVKDVTLKDIQLEIDQVQFNLEILLDEIIKIQNQLETLTNNQKIEDLFTILSWLMSAISLIGGGLPLPILPPSLPLLPQGSISQNFPLISNS